MSNTYTCDTCGGTVRQSQQFDSGVLRCESLGCSGTLRLFEQLHNVDINNNIDSSKMRWLVTHNQTQFSKQWVINHNGNTHPIVKVYNQTESNNVISFVELSTDRFDVTYKDNNTVVINLDGEYMGFAHCIMRDSSLIDQSDAMVATQSYTQITSNGVLTIAVEYNGATDLVFPLPITVIKPSTNDQEVLSLDMIAHKLNQSTSLFNTSWSDSELITIHSKVYRVYSMQLVDLFVNGELENGSIIQFMAADYEYNVLTSIPPYTNSPNDRNVGQYFNVESVDSIFDSNVIIQQQQIFVDNNKLDDAHPIIKTVSTVF